MAQIKYKAKQIKQFKDIQKIIQNEFEEYSKTVKQNKKEGIQSFHLPSADFADQREPEVVIWNNNSTEMKLSSKFVVEPLRISRAQSFKQPVRKDKEIPLVREFSSRKNVSPKKIGILDLLKNDIPLSQGKVAICGKNKTTQTYLIQKIINFRTKVMKISSKNINQQIQRKFPREKGVPQRLNNLYNIVVRNIQDDYDQVTQFANIKSLITQAKVTRKKEKTIQIENQQIDSDLKCRYSSERIYKQIRKQYNPLEKTGLRQISYQSAKQSNIIRKNIDKSLLKQAPSLNFNRPPKLNKRKSIKQDRLEGW